MSPSRIFITVLSIIVGLGVSIHFLTSLVAPTSQDPAVSAYDLTLPRTPSDAKRLQNPIPVSSEVIAMGKALYGGKGNCFVCHGQEGRGDGEGGSMLNPPPRDFSDPTFQHLRTDGEIFWTMKYGIPATGMFSYIPRHLSEEEGWRVVHYIRALNRNRQSSELLLEKQ